MNPVLKVFCLLSFLVCPLFGKIVPDNSPTEKTNSEGLQFKIEDPKHNLTGDPNRGYLDITHGNLVIKPNEISINLQFAQPFPIEEALLGTGFRIKTQYLKTNEDPNLPDEVISIVRYDYGFRGWVIAEESPDASGTDPTSSNIHFQSSSNSITATHFDILTENIDSITIETTTANYPKWLPITSNPPVLLPLRNEKYIELN